MRPRALAAAFPFLMLACRTAGPVLTPLSAEDPRPAALLAAWGRDAEARHALRGRARLAVDGAGGALHVRGQNIVALERPARLRVEVLGFLEQTIAVLVTDGERYQVFRADTHAYADGPVRADLLWQQAGLPVTPEEAIDLLLGAPAPDPALAAVFAQGDERGDVALELADEQGRVRRRACFDAEGRLLWLEAIGVDGALRWRAEYSDYTELGGVAFARDVSLDGAGTKAEISLSDVELNPVLPAALFRLPAPAPDGRGG